MDKYIPYNPGRLPTKPSPDAGDKITIKVKGLPPYKDRHFSIRNSRHKIHNRFKELRNNAIKVMGGRAPYRGAVHIVINIYTPQYDPGKNILDYEGGVMDSLDGSHGPNFTYLPIVYEDDCQVCSCGGKLIKNDEKKYEVLITFL